MAPKIWNITHQFASSPLFLQISQKGLQYILNIQKKYVGGHPSFHKFLHEGRTYDFPSRTQSLEAVKSHVKINKNEFQTVGATI